MVWNKLDTNREKSYLEKQNVQKNESRSCKQAQSSPPFDAKTCSIEKIQPWPLAYKRLLNKPYVNEVTLTRQNPPLKSL